MNFFFLNHYSSAILWVLLPQQVGCLNCMCIERSFHALISISPVNSSPHSGQITFEELIMVQNPRMVISYFWHVDVYFIGRLLTYHFFQTKFVPRNTSPISPPMSALSHANVSCSVHSERCCVMTTSIVVVSDRMERSWRPTGGSDWSVFHPPPGSSSSHHR